MGEWVKAKAADGNELEAYVARPEGKPRGSLIVVQEIYGVNRHIQGVADSYASDGYVAIAPALFDRFEPGVKLDYGEADRQKAFELYGKLDPQKALLDIVAAARLVDGEGAGTGVLGFCYGGLMAWLSATRGADEGFTPRCAVGYYAGGIGKFASETPSCPVLLHFGMEDTHIGMDQVEAVRKAHPEVKVFLYEGAKHAFNRDVDPASYDPAAARVARERTLAFFRDNLA